MKYLNNPELRLRHGINARRRVVRDFRPEPLWRAYLQRFVRLAEAKKIEVPRIPEGNEKAISVDLDTDEGEIRQWLAIREHLLRGKTIEEACVLFEAHAGRVHEKIALVRRTENRKVAA